MGVLSEEEIRGETVSTMIAGFETTASGSSFALMLLAFHPDIQDRAFQELVDIFGNDKMQPATFEDLKEMTYLEQIIMETLRLYPSVPITMRDVEEEIPIKNYIIPADCTIMIKFLVIQRNPKYFTNPDKFDPDNFSPEKKSTRHPFVFKPFSDGPRVCVVFLAPNLEFSTFNKASDISRVNHRKAAGKPMLALVPCLIPQEMFAEDSEW
uniref:Cytochrome P450 n=1 Tax=Timema shepardi TaxID=629360 RepID=A0A7R9B440_TIMSH|nr:unnamed protein product [Timema shepardi]